MVLRGLCLMDGRPIPAAILAVSIGLTSSIFVGGRAEAQTLQQALVQTYESNPTLRASRMQVRQSDAQLDQAEGGWEPQLDLLSGGGYATLFSQQDQESAAAGSSTFSQSEGPVVVLSLRLRQPIYNFYTGPRVQQAENTSLAARWTLQATEQDIFLRATSAYLDVVRTQAAVKTAEEQEQWLNRTLQSTRRLFNNGQVPMSGVTESEATLGTWQARRAAAEADLASARARYLELVGEVPGDLTLPDIPPNLPSTEDELLTATRDNPSILAAHKMQDAADDGVDMNVGLRLPEFFVQGTLDARSGSVLGLMSVPLYNGLQGPRIDEAKEVARQRRYQAEAVTRQIQSQAISAWSQFKAAQTNVTTLTSSVSQREQTIERMEREREIGLRSTTDVLSNQVQLAESRLQLLTAQQQTRVAAYTVLYSMGRLTARGLNLPVQLYDTKPK